jgi:hypothetical protein
MGGSATQLLEEGARRKEAAMSEWIGSSVRIVLVVAGVCASAAVAQRAAFSVLRLLLEPNADAGLGGSSPGGTNINAALAYLSAVATFILLSALTVKAVYWRRPIDRALTILCAYVCACVGAGVAFALVYVSLSLRSGYLPTLTGAVMMALVLATWIAIFALPTALAVLIATEQKGIRSPLFYTATGIFAALIGYAIYLLVLGDLAGITAVWILIAPGIVGGLIYWALAGRNAGMSSGAVSASGGS